MFEAVVGLAIITNTIIQATWFYITIIRKKD